MSGTRRIVVRMLMALGFALLLAACHQNGTVFAVDTTDDTVDANPGDGICADANGDCSLRAAVMEANALPGVEEIQLTRNSWLRTEEGVEDTVATGDLDITSGVVFTGSGLIRTHERIPRAFDVNLESGLVEFDGVVLRDGGIRARGSGAVVLRDADLQTFSAPAVELDGPLLTMDAVTIRNVSADSAIRALEGRLTIQNATFTRNHVRQGVIDILDSDVQLVHVTIAKNEVVDDGDVAGIHLDPSGTGSALVQSSIIQAAGSLGDGIACFGPVTGLGHNYTDDETCGFVEPTDIVVEYPSLRLSNSENTLPVLIPDPLSVVVDAAADGNCTSDDRDAVGTIRPDGVACDIGAVEVMRGDCLDPRPFADLQLCDFRDRDFSYWDLRGVDLRGAYLSGANFSHAVLAGALVQPAELEGGDFTGADLEGAILGSNDRVILDGANLRLAFVGGVEIESAVGTDLTDAHVSSIRLSHPGASLAGSIVEGTTFQWVDFGGVSSGGVTGTPAALPDGFSLVNGYFIGTDANIAGGSFAGVDLDGVVVHQVDARGADFTGATFGVLVAASNLSGAILDESVFRSGNAGATVFNDASIVGADFDGSVMRSTRWEGAVLIGTNLAGVDLRNARFTDAVVLWNTFDNTICPSGVNSDDNGGNCDGQWNGNEPLSGAAAMQALSGLGLEGLSAADFVPAE